MRFRHFLGALPGPDSTHQELFGTLSATTSLADVFRSWLLPQASPNTQWALSCLFSPNSHIQCTWIHNGMKNTEIASSYFCDGGCAFSSPLQAKEYLMLYPWTAQFLLMFHNMLMYPCTLLHGENERTLY